MPLDMAASQEQVDKLRAILRTWMDEMSPDDVEAAVMIARGIVRAEDMLPLAHLLAAAALFGIHQAMLDDLAERGSNAAE